MASAGLPPYDQVSRVRTGRGRFARASRRPGSLQKDDAEDHAHDERQDPRANQRNEGEKAETVAVLVVEQPYALCALDSLRNQDLGILSVRHCLSYSFRQVPGRH